MERFFLIFSLLLFTFNLHADELKWVDEQIEAIKPPREGVDDANITALKDPFIFLHKKLEDSSVASTSLNSNSIQSSGAKQKTYSSFYVTAIMNKSAMINGKWYKIDDKVGSYTMTDVGKTTVTLSKNGKKIVLSTTTKNSNLKFNNK